MSCFTFEFGTPDSHFYHIPEGSVSHVKILSRGITGDIYFKWPGNDLCDVPRAICEDLVAWMDNGTPTAAKNEPRTIAKPIGWEGTFSEAVRAMQEGWKIKRGCWANIRHLMKVDDKIITHQGLEWSAISKDILATDWELVDD